METVSTEQLPNFESIGRAIEESDKSGILVDERNEERDEKVDVIAVPSEKDPMDQVSKDSEEGQTKKRYRRRKHQNMPTSCDNKQIARGDISIQSEPLTPRPPSKDRPKRPQRACSVSSTSSIVRRTAFRPKTHDDLLNEKYSELAELLKGSHHLNADELRNQHHEQTRNLILDYQNLSGGATPRSILISRSLPESMRTPNSRSNSAAPSPRGVTRSSNNSRRASVDSYQSSSSLQSSKRVTFNTGNSLNNPNDKRIPSRNSSTIQQEILKRAAFEVQPRYPYLKSDIQTQYSHLNKPIKGEQRSLPPSNDSTPRSTATVSTINSARSSRTVGVESHDLKDTDTLLVKAWAIQKDRERRGAKRRQRAEERKKREAEEDEKRRSEERALDAEHAVKKWKAQKRIEAQNARKAKRRAASLIGNVRESPIGKESTLNATLHATSNIANKSETDTAPLNSKKLNQSVASESKRPKSAQAPRSTGNEPVRKTVPDKQGEKSKPYSAPTVRKAKPSQVTIQTIIDNTPTLQRKIKDLEKQKRLKYRQSHDEWIKVKEIAKKEQLKQIQQKREQIEREISEETARLITETARKRADQIKSQYPSRDEQKQKTAKKETRKNRKEENPVYQWRATFDKARDILNDTKPSTSNEPKKKKPTPRRNIEDRIGNNTNNPFQGSNPSRRSTRAKFGVNEENFSHFIRDLGKAGNPGARQRPQPQGADAPQQSGEQTTGTQQTSNPKSSSENVVTNLDPVIETGRTIFSMTSIET